MRSVRSADQTAEKKTVRKLVGTWAEFGLIAPVAFGNESVRFAVDLSPNDAARFVQDCDGLSVRKCAQQSDRSVATGLTQHFPNTIPIEGASMKF